MRGLRRALGGVERHRDPGLRRGGRALDRLQQPDLVDSLGVVERLTADRTQPLEEDRQVFRRQRTGLGFEHVSSPGPRSDSDERPEEAGRSDRGRTPGGHQSLPPDAPTAGPQGTFSEPPEDSLALLVASLDATDREFDEAVPTARMVLALARPAHPAGRGARRLPRPHGRCRPLRRGGGSRSAGNGERGCSVQRQAQRCRARCRCRPKPRRTRLRPHPALTPVGRRVDRARS